MRVAAIGVLSFVTSGPVGGFIFGVLNCSDCGFKILGRVLVGCVMAFLVPLSAGFPPQNEGGVGEPFNAWPHILITWVLLFALLVRRDIKRNSKQ